MKASKLINLTAWCKTMYKLPWDRVYEPGLWMGAESVKAYKDRHQWDTQAEGLRHV